jgi:hypothetical protein
MARRETKSPSGEILLEILGIAEKHALNDHEFENELLIAVDLIRKCRKKFGDARGAYYYVFNSLEKRQRAT